MKRLILFCILSLLFSFSVLNAQEFSDNVIVDQTSDPIAEKIMKGVKEKYQAFTSMEVAINIKIEGEGEEEEQSMKAKMKGDKYRLEMVDKDVICDGETIWFHLKDINEVQINNPATEEDELTPTGMIKLYEQDMIYVMVGEAKEDGRTVYKIEFKPKDRDMDFSKFRVSIDKQTSEVTRIIAFSKAASRYILTFSNLKANGAIGDEQFSFDPKNFKDIIVEDLRLE
ncbi:MAG: outer membrane lipoprotein carrier protein LolA [Bacteroidota bacterium]